MRYRDVTLTQFVQKTENKVIICVGGGELLEGMFLLGDDRILDRVIAIVDNYKAGQDVL